VVIDYHWGREPYFPFGGELASPRYRHGGDQGWAACISKRPGPGATIPRGGAKEPNVNPSPPLFAAGTQVVRSFGVGSPVLSLSGSEVYWEKCQGKVWVFLGGLKNVCFFGPLGDTFLPVGGSRGLSLQVSK